jgi:dTDP-D-glucose 4,6-dehydratase
MDGTCSATSGAGFIGSNFILHRLKEKSAEIVNAGNLTNAGSPRASRC